MASPFHVKGQQNVTDVLCIEGIQGLKSVTTTPSLACVGSVNKSVRKMLLVHNKSKTATIYWGFTDSVTKDTGFPITPYSSERFMVSQDMEIYLVSGSGTVSVVVGEAI